MRAGTIYVDIMINDQTDVGAIQQELDTAKGFYRRAKHHLIAGSKGVLKRAWCLYEIAVRREARSRSQLLFVLSFDSLTSDLGIEQEEPSKLDITGLDCCCAFISGHVWDSCAAFCFCNFQCLLLYQT